MEIMSFVKTTPFGVVLTIALKIPIKEPCIHMSESAMPTNITKIKVNPSQIIIVENIKMTSAQTQQTMKLIAKKMNSFANSRNPVFIRPSDVMELSIALVLKMKTSTYAMSHQNPPFQKLPPSIAMRVAEVVTSLKS